MATHEKVPVRELTSIGITEARAQLGELVDKVRYLGAPIILEKMGKPVAAIVSIDELDRMRRTRWEATKVFDQIAAEFAKSGLSDAELEALAYEAAAWAKSNRE